MELSNIIIQCIRIYTYRATWYTHTLASEKEFDNYQRLQNRGFK